MAFAFTIANTGMTSKEYQNCQEARFAGAARANAVAKEREYAPTAFAQHHAGGHAAAAATPSVFEAIPVAALALAGATIAEILVVLVLL